MRPRPGIDQGIGGRPLMGFNRIRIMVPVGVGVDVRSPVDAYLGGGLPAVGMDSACQH